MTAGGYTDINDVKKVYDELSIWEKREFVLNEMDHIGELTKDDMYEYGILNGDMAVNAKEAVHIFGERDLLDEMDEDEIRDYCKGWYSPLDFVDIVEVLEDQIEKTSKPTDKMIQFLAEALKPWKDKIIPELQKM